MKDRRPPPPHERPEEEEERRSGSHDGRRSGSHDGRRSGSHDGRRSGSHEERSEERETGEFRPRPGPGREPHPEGNRPEMDECAPRLGLNVEVTYGDYFGKIYYDDWSLYRQSKYTISDCPADEYKFRDDDGYGDDDSSSGSRSRDDWHRRGGHGRGGHHRRQRRSEHETESQEDSHEHDGHRRRYWPRGNCTWKSTRAHSEPRPTRPGSMPSTTSTPTPEKLIVSDDMRQLMGEVKEALYYKEEFPCYIHIDTNMVVVQEPPMFSKSCFSYILIPVAIGVLLIVLMVKKICQAKNPKQVADVEKKEDVYKVPQGVVEVSNKAIEAGVGEKDPITLGPEVVPEGDQKNDVVLMSGPVVMEKQAEALAALSPRDLVKDTVPPVDVERIESPPPPYGDSTFA